MFITLLHYMTYTEVVLMAELIKLFVSGYLAVSDKAETDAVGKGFGKLIWLLIHARKIILLVILYSISNLLSYFALARVDASVYTVMLQLKTLTTPAFAVVLLGRNISSSKWRALLLLVLGCILVASPTFNQQTFDCTSSRLKQNDEDRVTMVESFTGIAGILLMVTISGYSAIYFEAMLKKAGERITIWERNFQLAFYSILLLLTIISWEMLSATEAAVMSTTSSKSSSINHSTWIRLSGLFEKFSPLKGWTMNTVGITMIQALGGLLVAATLKYADAILKTLATSGSIVLSAVLGYLLLGGTLDVFVTIGCISTILAIFNYTLDN